MGNQPGFFDVQDRYEALSRAGDPLEGFMLIYVQGYDPFESWLVLTYVLYVIAAICWVPVVFIQVKMRNILNDAMKNGATLPDEYHKLYKIWFALGGPAFLSLIGIFWLMVTKH